MLVFSTHAFTEGDVLSSFFGWLYAISTHAFTEGDGVQLKRKFYWKRISTHAFAEGDISVPRVLEYECISTHAFTEGDRISIRREITQKIISTHAFTEGDPIVAVEPFLTIRFQLTPSRKATGEAEKRNSAGRFQLTPSRKATPSRWIPAAHPGYFNSRLHGRRLQIQIIFAAKHFLFLLILSKFLILAFLFHLASLRFSLHPVIFPVRISLYFSVYLPFALETCTLCHNI